MLTGAQLGNAIRVAIGLKGVTQTAVAKHFGVKPPSIQDWIKRGVISKEKLPRLWEYFSDVVGPEHWGLDNFPTGISSIGAATPLKRRPAEWPLPGIDLNKVAQLGRDDAMRLEGAILTAASQLNLDIQAPRSGKQKKA